MQAKIDASNFQQEKSLEQRQGHEKFEQKKII